MMKNSSFSGGGSGTGIKATGDASAVKAVATKPGSANTNKPQSSYNSELSCDQVDSGAAGHKGYYGDRNGR